MLDYTSTESCSLENQSVTLISQNSTCSIFRRWKHERRWGHPYQSLSSCYSYGNFVCFSLLGPWIYFHTGQGSPVATIAARIHWPEEVTVYTRIRCASSKPQKMCNALYLLSPHTLRTPSTSTEMWLHIHDKNIRCAVEYFVPTSHTATYLFGFHHLLS